MRILVMNLTAMKESMALCKNWCSCHYQKYQSACLLSLICFSLLISLKDFDKTGGLTLLSKLFCSQLYIIYHMRAFEYFAKVWKLIYD